MSGIRIEHGRNYILDMEIDDYRNIYLSELFEDTIVDFEYVYFEESQIDLHDLRQIENSAWKVVVPIKCGVNKQLFATACKEISTHNKFLIDYAISSEKYSYPEITVMIDRDMSIAEAYDYAIDKRDMVINYISSLENSRLSGMIKEMIIAKLPVYFRAMKKVELELSNFITDEEKNSKKIIEICSRVKTIESIQEKVYRKSICQFDVFERFDDIAGVRCTCEFLSDVYDVLEYIQKNPLFHVCSVEDKILYPSREGYRGIHVIVTTDVFYHGSVYENVKVEMQLRTAFQNAWSMKTHQLTYKQESISDEMTKAMREMSDALKAADEVAQNIKNALLNT